MCEKPEEKEAEGPTAMNSHQKRLDAGHVERKQSATISKVVSAILLLAVLRI